MTAPALTSGIRQLPLTASLLVLGGAVGYLAVASSRAALLVALLPIGLALFSRPAWGVVVGIATLPFLTPLVGSEFSSVRITTTDLVFVFVSAGLLPLWLLVPEWRDRLLHLKPALGWAIPYVGWLIVVLAAHVSGRSAFKTMTALETIVLPLVFGACVVDRRQARWALRAFVVTTCLLSVVYLVDGSAVLAGNKNAAGQFIALGLLVAVVLSRGRLRGFLPVPLLFAGLLFASSRGAVVAVAFGAIALLGLRGLGSWKRTAASVAVLSIIVVVGYNAVPARVQARIAVILHSNDRGDGPGLTDVEESTDYNLKIRATYRHDALAVIRDHPVFGVGTGQYFAGSGLTVSNDPHNLVLKAAAEGGILGAATFAWFVLGTTFLLVRRLGRNPWAGLAIAVQVASITHGMVDVYFIRGIPVLGWFLVGIALNPRLDRRPRA